MKTIQLRFKRSFYLRQGFVGGMQAFFCLVILISMKNGGLLLKMTPVLLLVPWFLIVLREYIIAAKQVDDEGVTRNDGKRFLWTNLKKVNEVRMIIAGQHTGPVNHLDIIFTGGRVRILLIVLENAIEAWQFVQKKQKQMAAAQASAPATANAAEPAPAPPAAQSAAPPRCDTCGTLGDYHRGFQKGGDEAHDTFLPSASGALKTVKDIDPDKRPTQSLRQCPACGAWFLHESSYEHLVYGSEDEQTLSRITAEKARDLLGG